MTFADYKKLNLWERLNQIGNLWIKK
jgi:hypothetical protein